MITKEKSFLIALLLLVFTTLLGGHRVYLKESIFPLFWYGIAAILTCGILVLYDLFTLKSKVIEANLMHKAVFKK